MRIDWSSISRSRLSKILSETNSGVYAWYYNVNISEFDSEKFFEVLTATENVVDKQKIVKDFLVKNIFNFFKYPDYDAKISGPLIPTFSGKLTYEVDLTDSLVEKIVSKPELVFEIKSAINGMAPEFSSPLYVGMASNLKRRLIQHKNLISSIKESKSIRFDDDISLAERNFAARVVSRDFILDDLFVCVSDVKSDNGLHNVVENIINRINYPILGRN